MGRNNEQRRRAKAQARRAARNQGRSRQPTDPGEQLTEHHAGELISLALDALDDKRHEEFQSVVGLLSQLFHEGSARRAAARLLRQSLRSGITRAWHGGWQPADLHRLAGRRLESADQAVLTDAMADELSSYAAATLDPRWAAQLREAEVRVWWPADQTYLEARRQRSDGLPHKVIASAVKVLHLLSTIPMLERLGPLPGTAVPSSATRRAPGAPEVDERILSRVRALLAKAESTTFEAEAETFTAGAQALMARHSIDAALLAASHAGQQGSPEGRRIGIDNPYEAPKVSLLAAVADANRCRTVWSNALGFTTIVGFATDLDAVETLFTSLLVQATRAMTREGSRTDHYGRSRTRAFRQSFLSAYATRIGERLTEVSLGETEAAAQAAHRAGGAELVPLLQARSAAVNDAVESMFPELVMRRLGGVTDAEGWHSGRTAADLATIGSGRQVEDGGGNL